MGRRPAVISLSQEDRKYLELQSRSRTVQAQIMIRSKILLMKADGYSIEAIAEKMDVNRKSVMLCIDKYKAGGVENALTDAPGRGRNSEITEEERAWILHIVLQNPQTLGYPNKTWSYAKLTEHIHKIAESSGYLRLSTIHKTTVNTILDEAGIKPYRLSYSENGKSAEAFL